MKIRDLRFHKWISVMDRFLEEVMFPLDEAWVIFINNSTGAAGCPPGKKSNLSD